MERKVRMRAAKVETEVRREQIAQAALRIVASQGVKALTVDRVAKMVGVVPSAIYRHYPGKAEIIDTALELVADRFRSIVANAEKTHASPLETIRAILTGHLELVMEFNAIPKLLFSDDAFAGKLTRKERFRQLLFGFFGLIEGVVARGQKAGQIRSDLPAASIALQYLGMFQPAAMAWYLTGGEFDIVRQLDVAFRLFAKSVEP